YGLGGDHMHQRASLNSGEYSFVQFQFLRHGIAAHDHTAAGTAQRLMRRRRGHMGVRNGTGMLSGSYQTGDMSDIRHQVSSHLIGNLAELFKIDGSSVCAGSARSEEHTSELQSRFDLVCRLLLEKKKK